MARISTGESYGGVARRTPAQLLGGAATTSVQEGALGQQQLGTPALQPQAAPVSTFVQSGAPTLSGPVIVPQPPALPRPSQDLAALADALSSFNQNLAQFGTSYIRLEQEKEKQAEARGSAAAARVARFGGFKDYGEAIREVEKKVAVDPSLTPLLTELRSLDPRAQPYADAMVADALIKQRMGTLKEEMANTARLPDGRPLETVSQEDPAFFDLMVSKVLPEGISPRAILNNQSNMYALFGSVRADQAKRHADHKDEVTRMGFIRGVSGGIALLNSGQINSQDFAGFLGQQLNELYANSRPSLYREQRDKLLDNLAEAVVAGAAGDPAVLDRMAPAMAQALETVPAGPNGEPLIDQFGRAREAVINDFYRKVMTGVSQDRELQDKRGQYRGQDAADNDYQQYITPEVRNSPAELQARLDALPQRAAQLFPDDPDAQLAYMNRVQSRATNDTKAYIAPIQRDAAAQEYARQAMNPSADPSADIVRYTQMFQARQLDEADYKSLVAGARARNEKRNDRNYEMLRGLQRDLQQRLTEQFKTTNEGDGSPAVTPQEAVEIRKSMGEFYRAGEEMILKEPGANLDQKLGTLYENYVMPAVQRGQERAQQPASKSPEDIAKTFRPGRGNAADNAKLRRQAETRPLYTADRMGAQLDQILQDKPLDNATRQIIRRSGMKPSEFFTRQMQLHGIPLDPEIQQQLRKLDGSDLVSSAQPTSAPSSSVASRLWKQWGSAVANAFIPPAAAGTMPPMGAMTTDGGGFNQLLATLRAGEGGWNSVNRGRAGDTQGGIKNLTSLPIGVVEEMQKRGRVFAVGAYQFTPGVLTRARREAGLSPNDPMTPVNQNRMALALVLGSKRPALAAYVKGESNDINAAHQDIALEWAALEGPNGRGMYDGDRAGNMASIRASKVRAALQAARRAYLMR